MNGSTSKGVDDIKRGTSIIPMGSRPKHIEQSNEVFPLKIEQPVNRDKFSKEQNGSYSG